MPLGSAAAYKLEPFVVIYADYSQLEAKHTFIFICSAENPDHAVDLCISAHPNIEILWVYRGSDMALAIKEYQVAFIN